MAFHRIEPKIENLHGHYSRELPPVLSIDSGDTISYQIPDAAWGEIDNPNPFERPPKIPGRDRELHPGHALCGPVEIRKAKAGMTLEIRLKTLRAGKWGWSSGGGYVSKINTRLGLDEPPEWIMRWKINQNLAINQWGQQVPIRPFLGNLGMPPDEPGKHSTFPPRFCGGNIDCKELIEGSVLFLPIPIDGGLFSIGDGHAVQGDGEVAGPALECPLERVEIELILHEQMHISFPYARAPVGWVTFGFHKDLNEAAMIALDGMLDLMEEKFSVERKEALAWATLGVDLRITQLVNTVCGVHAILPAKFMDGLSV